MWTLLLSGSNAYTILHTQLPLPLAEAEHSPSHSVPVLQAQLLFSTVSIYSNDCGTPNYSFVINATVNALPSVTAASSSSVICNTQTITVNGSGANTYTPGASVGTATNGVAFSPSATANYSVVGTNTLTGCTSTNNAVVTVAVNACRWFHCWYLLVTRPFSVLVKVQTVAASGAEHLYGRHRRVLIRSMVFPSRLQQQPTTLWWEPTPDRLHQHQQRGGNNYGEYTSNGNGCGNIFGDL